MKEVVFKTHCDKCGDVVFDPWHTSEGNNRHVHLCDTCHQSRQAWTTEAYYMLQVVTRVISNAHLKIAIEELLERTAPPPSYVVSEATNQKR